MDSQIADRGVRTVLILGDLTDAKDNHSAKLVYRVVDAISELASTAEQVIILMGNHDYLQEGHPFFGFLDNVLPNVHFIDRRALHEATGTLFLPHTHHPTREWVDIEWSSYRQVFMHQTVSGAIASNGSVMHGELESAIVKVGRPPLIFSGDIHVPQKIGDVEYVGSPYHVHFGDRFKPRALFFEKFNHVEALHFETLEKFSINVRSLDELRRLGIRPGDQLKVRFEIKPRDFSLWEDIRLSITQWCQEREVDLRGLELIVAKRRKVLTESQVTSVALSVAPVDMVKKFGEHEKLAEDVIEVGQEMVR